jgi:hypothetical protein
MHMQHVQDANLIKHRVSTLVIVLILLSLCINVSVIRSTVLNEQDTSEVRTSSTCWLREELNPALLEPITELVERLSELPATHQESLQVVSSCYDQLLHTLSTILTMVCCGVSCLVSPTYVLTEVCQIDCSLSNTFFSTTASITLPAAAAASSKLCNLYHVLTCSCFVLICILYLRSFITRSSTLKAESTCHTQITLTHSMTSLAEGACAHASST